MDVYVYLYLYIYIYMEMNRDKESNKSCVCKLTRHCTFVCMRFVTGTYGLVFRFGEQYTRRVLFICGRETCILHIGPIVAGKCFRHEQATIHSHPSNLGSDGDKLCK